MNKNRARSRPCHPIGMLAIDIICPTSAALDISAQSRSRRLDQCKGTASASAGDSIAAPLTAPGAASCAADMLDRQRGFTLLELLVVLAIIGLLVGLVAPAALHQLGSAKEKIAHQSIERITSVLDMYKLDIGSYPTTDQGLQALISRPPGLARWDGPYMKGNKIPEDPWGRPFQYRSPSQRPGHEFDLYSLGPSGQSGGTATAAIYNE